MSEELNVSGQDTGLENGEVSTENGALEGTAEQDTGLKNKNADDIQVDENEINTDNEGDGSQDTPAEEGSAQDGTDADEVFLTADDGNVIPRSQAENFAKMGYEYLNVHKPILEKLERIAANSKNANGEAYSSLDEFADVMLEAIDDNLRRKCLADAHGDEEIANELFNTRKAQRDESFNNLQEQRAKAKADLLKSKTQRVAADFERLQKKFPEITSYADLPKEVKTYAAKNNVSLLEAKLTLDYDNRIASEKAKTSALTAAEKSTGSQSGEGNSGDSVIEAMLRGARR